MNYVSDENGEARVDLPDGIYIFRLWARAKGHVPLFAHWEEEEKPEESLLPQSSSSGSSRGPSSAAMFATLTASRSRASRST